MLALVTVYNSSRPAVLIEQLQLGLIKFSQESSSQGVFQTRVLIVLTDPHTGKALVIANQSRNVRSNTKRSVNSAVRAAYRSLAAFFIDLRPK